MTTALKPRKRKPHVCPKCGGTEVRVHHYADTVDFKGLTIDVEGLAETVCNSCSFRWATEGQEQDNLDLLRAAFAIKRDKVREAEGLLTGEQIQFVLTELNLSKADAAALFGGGPNAFSKYISGDVLQSYPMDRLLRVTLAFGAHAVSYLRRGNDAPLALNAGGYFVASAISGNSSQVALGVQESIHVNARMVVSSGSPSLTIGS